MVTVLLSYVVVKQMFALEEPSEQLPIIRVSHAQTQCYHPPPPSCRRGSCASHALIGSSSIFTTPPPPGLKPGR